MKNNKAFKQTIGNRGVNTSLLCVIDISGIVAFDIQNGAFNSEKFVSFIENNLITYFSANPTKILIMDNVKFHHSQIIKTVFNNHNISFKYLPAYSPQLNPIEEFFSMIKARFCALKNEYVSIIQCLNEVLNSNFSNECSGFYLNMRRWIETARANQPFI